MRIPADLKTITSPAARLARRKRGMRFVKDVRKGFAKDAVDTAKGLQSSGIAIWKLTGGALIDPKDAATRWKLVGKVSAAAAKNPSMIVKALVDPYAKAWKSGHLGEAYGRILFEIVAALAVGEVMSKLAHSLEGAGKLLNLAANSADDVAQAMARIGLAAEEFAAHK